MRHTTTKPMTRYFIYNELNVRSVTQYKTCLLNFESENLPQLQVGVEFEASTRMQDTSMSFGYQLDVPKANLLFKGIGRLFLSCF